MIRIMDRKTDERSDGLFIPSPARNLAGDERPDCFQPQRPGQGQSTANLAANYGDGLVAAAVS